MTVSEKVAYLKGLADGLGVKDSTNEGKLMLAVIDVLEAMAYDIEAVDAHAKDLSDSISDINEDMEYLEDLCIGDMDDDDEELDDDSDDADVLSGVVEYLEQQGFRTETSIEWYEQEVSVYSEDIDRILNNIVSNIVKYADAGEPVRISSVSQDGYAGFVFENTVASVYDSSRNASSVPHFHISRALSLPYISSRQSAAS